MADSSFHVVVIGGGIGGLCLAQGLRKAGVPVSGSGPRNRAAPGSVSAPDSTCSLTSRTAELASSARRSASARTSSILY